MNYVTDLLKSVFRIGYYEDMYIVPMEERSGKMKRHFKYARASAFSSGEEVDEEKDHKKGPTTKGWCATIMISMSKTIRSASFVFLLAEQTSYPYVVQVGPWSFALRSLNREDFTSTGSTATEVSLL